ncbi:MAG TPA: NAD-dependent epimerase/dehydratase family protein, partial [Actinomycetota bacterium]|nr:NAD-dependent epimerase/dehydratase family protein [Actinomycetota bacterium]
EIHTKERSVLSGGMDGVVLRYGLFYGPGVGSTELMAKLLRRRMMALPGGGRGVASWIHIEDAAEATVSALERGRAGGSTTSSTTSRSRSER